MGLQLPGKVSRATFGVTLKFHTVNANGNAYWYFFQVSGWALSDTHSINGNVSALKGDSES